MYSYEQIRLWPEGAPTQSGLSGAETEVDPGFVGNITDPHLFVYPAPKPVRPAYLSRGGHSFALRDTFRYKAQWTGELERWLQLTAP